MTARRPLVWANGRLRQLPPGDSLDVPSALAGSYQSSQQTITTSGTLTLAHGLGVEPVLIWSYLVCANANNGYAVGDKLAVQLGIDVVSADALTGGAVARFDSTNIYIRFALRTTVFLGLHKATGALVTFANSDWRYVVGAAA